MFGPTPLYEPVLTRFRLEPLLVACVKGLHQAPCPYPCHAPSPHNAYTAVRVTTFTPPSRATYQWHIYSSTPSITSTLPTPIHSTQPLGRRPSFHHYQPRLVRRTLTHHAGPYALSNKIQPPPTEATRRSPWRNPEARPR